MKEYDYDAITQRLVAARKKLGLTQEKLSEKLYINRSTLSRYETSIEMPLNILAEYARLTGESLDFLVWGSDEKRFSIDEIVRILEKN